MFLLIKLNHVAANHFLLILSHDNWCVVHYHSSAYDMIEINGVICAGAFSAPPVNNLAIILSYESIYPLTGLVCHLMPTTNRIMLVALYRLLSSYCDISVLIFEVNNNVSQQYLFTKTLASWLNVGSLFGHLKWPFVARCIFLDVSMHI